MTSQPEIEDATTRIGKEVVKARDLGRELEAVFQSLAAQQAILQKVGLDTGVSFLDRPALHAAWTNWKQNRGAPELPQILRAVSE